MLICAVGAASRVFAGEEIAAERVVYAETDSSKLKATVYLPAGEMEGLRPAVLLIHGGGWLAGTRHQMDWYGRALAREGYVAMTVGYRKMPWHPFPDCLYDVKAAVRWLRLHSEEYGIDPERIGALGQSAGAHLALMLATTGPADGLEGHANRGASSAIRAAVSFYGPTDLTSYRRPIGRARLPKVAKKYVTEFAGEEHPANGMEPLAWASPITHADASTCPILFIHGEDDRIVPFEQTKAMHARLEALGVPTRLIAAPGYGHALDRVHRTWRKEHFGEISAFLGKYLAE